MNRTILAATAALILSTGATLADGVVPGSDTSIRQAQSRSDAAVATGAFRARISSTTTTTTSYGYPVADQSSGVVVPGSDTTVRNRHNAADAAVARGTFGARSTAATTSYGYPARAEASASDRADDRAVNRTAGVPTTSLNDVLVPASDSF